MAAYEASIFKTLEEADSEIYEVFLDIAVKKLHLKQGGIRAPLFHPLDFFESEKPFWERVIRSVTEDDEKARFAGWAVSTVPLKELNAALSKRNSFPEGVDASDFESFISLRARKALLNYLLGDAGRCLVITSAVQAQLKSVEEFCKRYKLDIEVLKNYEELAHVFGADSKNIKYVESFVVTSSSIQISEEMCQQKEAFLACQQVLLLDVLQLEKERKALEEKIEALCVENHLDKKAIMALAEKNEYAGSGGLQNVIHLAGEALALDAKIEAYKNEISTVKRSLKLLCHSKDYEKIITHLKENFTISSTFFAGKVIAICGHGLKHPYRLPLTEKEHRTILEKRLNTKLIEIKNEIYYRTAERGLFVIQNNLNSNPVERLRRLLDYITQVIELGSYETNIFNSEKIDYSISVEKVEKVANDVETKVEILRKQKSIPDFLYGYYSQLQKIKNSFNFESTFYSTIIDLKLLPPQENEIHYKWHLKFLNQLKAMVREEKMISAMPLQAFPNASLGSSSSLLSSRVSFQGEDSKKRMSRSGTPEPIPLGSPRLE